MTDEIDVVVPAADPDEVNPPEDMDIEVKTGVPVEPNDPASPEETPE